MNQLDLHGKSHSEVERLVENAVLLATENVHIITGNSTEMQRIVLEILDKHQVKHMTLAHNLGEVIAIYE